MTSHILIGMLAQARVEFLTVRAVRETLRRFLRAAKGVATERTLHAGPEFVETTRDSEVRMTSRDLMCFEQCR